MIIMAMIMIMTAEIKFMIMIHIIYFNLCFFI